MNKTTDELLKILVSEEDMQKYIEEITARFQLRCRMNTNVP